MPSMVNQIPAISVIIPCYNLGIYLDEAVQSVLAQTMHAFEIIIVDDGSTDKATCALLNNFNRPKTRLVRQENKGLAAARNRGIRESTGRYICCLDADDRLQPEFLEKAFTVLDTQPAVGFVTGYFQMFGERTDVFRYQTCAFPEMLVYNQAVEPSLFRREAWERAGGYCETFTSSGIEDWDLWITILELGYRAEVIPEIVWNYRMRHDQMSTKMYRPDTWGALCRELFVRHEKTYRKYMIEAMATQAARWAEIREWANARGRSILWWQQDAKNWQQLAEERERVLEEQLRANQEQQAWIGELEKAKDWLEGQRANWHRLAEEREQQIREQQAWIGELEKAKSWLEEQQSSSERLAGEREQMTQEQLRVNQEQQAWVGELEKAKDWLEYQRVNWHRLAEEREQQIREQQAWIGELEKTKNRLEERQSNLHQVAEDRERVIREQQTWVEELEKAKSWLEEQRSSWQRLAEEREQMTQEQQAWIEELEKGKSRLERHSSWWGWLKRVSMRSFSKLCIKTPG
jgi:glycosyltransferase involved in cell wall biosynthesis/predicted NUDIX family NTP pyrophosphohydrolase